MKWGAEPAYCPAESPPTWRIFGMLSELLEPVWPTRWLVTCCSRTLAFEAMVIAEGESMLR